MNTGIGNEYYDSGSIVHMEQWAPFGGEGSGIFVHRITGEIIEDISLAKEKSDEALSLEISKNHASAGNVISEDEIENAAGLTVAAKAGLRAHNADLIVQSTNALNSYEQNLRQLKVEASMSGNNIEVMNEIANLGILINQEKQQLSSITSY